ncbi:HAD family hydrolase [Lacticaseibacillus zhaodongensis]|uniref:HAD family hydrolase n=1 Tax=Lacticaseibacillus zhaodongensis TaxID=2668065 RepID=UPI0018B00C2E|nr:HAD family hydrolase [Lacticaseibacillus zhaodongensis]
MSKIKLVASDMDATLLDSAGRLPANFNNYVTALSRRGIQTVIASGRSLQTLLAMFPETQLSLICDNGGLIYRNGQIISAELVAPAIYRQLAAQIAAAGDVPCLCGSESVYVAAADRKYLPELQQFFSKITVVPDLQRLHVAVDKISAYCPGASAQQQYVAHYRQLCHGCYECTVSGPAWVDIAPRGVSKGRALRMLGALDGITTDQMLAFGNAANDKEMLQTAAYSFIVANADPGMEAYARFRTTSCDDNGVLRVLTQLLRQPKPPMNAALQA